MFKKDFLRIKFDDKDDDSISHTLKAYYLIDKMLNKVDKSLFKDALVVKLVDTKDLKSIQI